MDAAVKAKALETLDGMAEIIRNERLEAGHYSSTVVDTSRKGELCEGHRFCLLGSAWWAYGERKIVRDNYNNVFILGVNETDRGSGLTTRAAYLRDHPALAAVYDALNKCARRRIDRLDGDQLEDVAHSGFESEAEALFESVYNPAIDKAKLSGLVRSARKEIEAA